MTDISDDQCVFSDELLRIVFDSISAHIAIIDENGMILETNAAWNRFAADNGLPGPVDFSRMNYLAVCEAAGGQEYEATVSFHRRNLRVKLGLKNRQTNLRSFLLSMA